MGSIKLWGNRSGTDSLEMQHTEEPSEYNGWKLRFKLFRKALKGITCLKRNRNLQKQWQTIDPSDLKAGCDFLALVCAWSDLNSQALLWSSSLGLGWDHSLTSIKATTKLCLNVNFRSSTLQLNPSPQTSQTKLKKGLLQTWENQSCRTSWS